VTILLPAALLFAADTDANFHNAPAFGQGDEESLRRPGCGGTSREATLRAQLPCRATEGGVKAREMCPFLVDGKLESATPGEVFWFITKGDKDNGMPSWAQLPERQRCKSSAMLNQWDCRNRYTRRLQLRRIPADRPLRDRRPRRLSPTSAMRSRERFNKITANDLPKPYATSSANNGPDVVARSRERLSQLRPRDSRSNYSPTGLENPRTLRTRAERRHSLRKAIPGRIRIFRGLTSDGKTPVVCGFCHWPQASLWFGLLSSRA